MSDKLRETETLRLKDVSAVDTAHLVHEPVFPGWPPALCGWSMPNTPQTVALWEDLKQLARNVVEEMNRDAELSSRTGGLEFRLEDDEMVVMTTRTSPQMCLSIRPRAEVVDIHTRLSLGEADSTEREFHEELEIQAGESGLSLRNAEADVFTVDEAVFYILRPFLHLGTPGC